MVAGPIGGGGSGYELGNAYGSIIIDSSGVDAAVQRAQAAFDRGLASIGDSMQRFGDGVSRVGTNLTLLTAPLVAFGATGVKAASSFQDALKEIEVRTQATTEQMEMIRQKSLQIGRDTPFSAGQASEAFLQLLTSGQSLAEAMETIDAVMAGAAASGENLGFVSDSLTDIMASFQLQTSESINVIQALTDASGASSATFGDLVLAFQDAGGQAANFGLSVRETSSVLALFAERGIKGAQAGNQLRSMLTNMTRQTDDVQGMWKKLGISMFDATGAVRPLQDVLAELRVALDGMTDEERINTIQTLAGSFGSMGLTALTTGDSMEDMLAIMDEGADVADIAAGRMDTFSGAVEELRGSIETLQINAITPFMDNALTPLIRMVTSVINRINDWVVANPELTAQIVRVGAVLAALGPTLIVVGKAISAIGVLLATLANPVGLLITGLTLLGIAYRENILGIQDTLAPVIAAFEEFFRVLSYGTDPIDAVGAALVDNFGRGIADQFYELVNTFGALFSEIGTFLSGIFSRIDFSQILKIGATLLSLTNPLGIIKTLFETMFDVSVFDLFIQGIETITQIFANLNEGQSLVQALGLEGTGTEEFINTIATAFGNLIGFVQGTVVPGLQALGAWFLSDALPAIVNFVTGTVIPAIQNFVGFLGRVWSTVQPGLQALGAWFMETALPAVVGFIQGTVLPAIEGFIITLVDIWNRVSPTLQQLFDWFVTSALPLVVDFINDTVMPVITFLIDTLVGFWESIRPGLETFLNWIIDVGLPLAVNFLEGPVTAAFNNLINLISFLWEQVRPPLEVLRDGILGIFTWINENAIQPALDLIGSIITEITRVAGEVQRILGELGADIATTIDNLNPFTGSGFLNQGIFHVPGRDQGGPGYAGMAYAIRPRAGTEVFVPNTDGDFIPRIEEFVANRLMKRFGGGMGGNGNQIDQVNIYANSREEGRRAADGFEERMMEIERSKG